VRPSSASLKQGEVFFYANQIIRNPAHPRQCQPRAAPSPARRFPTPRHTPRGRPRRAFHTPRPQLKEIMSQHVLPQGHDGGVERYAARLVVFAELLNRDYAGQ
jgi:hypothetical protein